MITADTLSETMKENYNGVYIGHYELTDINTGVIAIGPTKVGRAKHLNAIFRGRNQGGANFVIDYFYPSDDYKQLEKEVHLFLKPHNLNHPRHKELYAITPQEAAEMLGDWL